MSEMQSDKRFIKRKKTSEQPTDECLFNSKAPEIFGIKVKPGRNDVLALNNDVLRLIDERPKFDYTSLSSSSGTEENSLKDEKIWKQLLENDLVKFRPSVTDVQKNIESVNNVAKTVDESVAIGRNFESKSQSAAEEYHTVECDLSEILSKCADKYIHDGRMWNFTALEYWNFGFTGYAIHLFKWAAKNCGFIPAYYNLGICFEETQDVHKAYKYYDVAAKCQHREANYNIGCLILRNPKLFPEEYGNEDGVKFIKTASELGLARAQALYGCLLMESPKEDMAKEAVSNFMKAAEQQCDDAKYRLGICYENGFGVPKDYVRAAELYNEASQADHPEAQHNLGVFYERGLGGLKKNCGKALKWYTRAVENGHEQSSVDIERLKMQNSFEDVRIVEAVNPVDG